MIDQQSAAGSSSGRKQYDIFHLTGKRPQQRSQGPQQQQSMPSTHISPNSIFGENKHQQINAIRRRMHATTGFFCGYCLPSTTFAWRSLTTAGTRNILLWRPRGRSHSQCCRVDFRRAGTVITITSFSVQLCIRLPRLYPCILVRVPTEIRKKKCTTTTVIPTKVPWGTYYNSITICFRTTYT